MQDFRFSKNLRAQTFQKCDRATPQRTQSASCSVAQVCLLRVSDDPCLACSPARSASRAGGASRRLRWRAALHAAFGEHLYSAFANACCHRDATKTSSKLPRMRKLSPGRCDLEVKGQRRQHFFELGMHTYPPHHAPSVNRASIILKTEAPTHYLSQGWSMRSDCVKCVHWTAL